MFGANHRRANMVTVATATLLTTGFALAQTPPADSPSQAASGQSAPEQGAPELTLTVKFPGGTASEYIAALKTSASFPVNIVLSPSAREVKLASIELEDAEVFTAVAAIKAATNGDGGDWLIQQLGVYTGQIRTPAGQPAFGVDYRHNLEPSGTRRNTPKQPNQSAAASDPTTELQVSVNSVRELLLEPGPEGTKGGMRPETVLSAVQAALDLASETDGPPPEVRFHPEAALLIVRGTFDQLSVVRETLQSLHQDARVREGRQDAQRAKNRAKSELDMQVQALDSQIAQWSNQLSELVEQNKKLDASFPEGNQAKAMLEKRQTQIDERTARLHALQTQRSILAMQAAMQQRFPESWVVLLMKTDAISPDNLAKLQQIVHTVEVASPDRVAGSQLAPDKSSLRVWTDDAIAQQLEALAKEFGCDSYRDLPSDPPGAGNTPDAPTK